MIRRVIDLAAAVALASYTCCKAPARAANISLLPRPQFAPSQAFCNGDAKFPAMWVTKRLAFQQPAPKEGSRTRFLLSGLSRLFLVGTNCFGLNCVHRRREVAAWCG